MHSNKLRTVLSALIASGVLVALPAVAGARTIDASPTCGDDKTKETKKPKPDDDKKPTNPSSTS